MVTYEVSSTLQFWPSWDSTFCFVNKDTKVSIFHKQELMRPSFSTQERSTGSELRCLKMPLSYDSVMHLLASEQSLLCNSSSILTRILLSFMELSQEIQPFERQSGYGSCFWRCLWLKYFWQKCFLFIIHTSRKESCLITVIKISRIAENHKTLFTYVSFLLTLPCHSVLQVHSVALFIVYAK